MDKMQILEKLHTCLYIINGTDNLYLKKELELVIDSLKELWNTEDIYMQEIKNVLDYDETMNNLNNI